MQMMGLAPDQLPHALGHLYVYALPGMMMVPMQPQDADGHHAEADSAHPRREGMLAQREPATNYTVDFAEGGATAHAAARQPHPPDVRALPDRRAVPSGRQRAEAGCAESAPPPPMPPPPPLPESGGGALPHAAALSLASATERRARVHAETTAWDDAGVATAPWFVEPPPRGGAARRRIRCHRRRSRPCRAHGAPAGRKMQRPPLPGATPRSAFTPVLRRVVEEMADDDEDADPRVIAVTRLAVATAAREGAGGGGRRAPPARRGRCRQAGGGGRRRAEGGRRRVRARAAAVARGGRRRRRHGRRRRRGVQAALVVVVAA